MPAADPLMRQAVGLSDVSTLGKIDVRGPDAGKLLDLAYINLMSSLKIGKARYGVMLREDGVILDDGTVSRLGEIISHHHHRRAAEVMSHLEHLVQVEFADGGLNLCDRCYGGMAWRIPNPAPFWPPPDGDKDAKGGRLLISGLALRGLYHRQSEGCPVRIHRISFSGELAYEICQTPPGVAVWQALMAAGEPLGIQPYGLGAGSAAH